jgi:hypothetical protein
MSQKTTPDAAVDATPEQGALATLFAAHTPTVEDGQAIVSLTDPLCPVCRGNLVLRRVEVREVFHALRSIDVYDGGVGMTADAVAKDEAYSDECQSVQSDEIVCDRGWTNCPFPVLTGNVSIDFD